MRNRWTRLRAPVAILAALALVTLGPGTASAADSSSGEDLVSQLEQQLAPAKDTANTTLSTPSSPPPAPSSDDDQPGHETEDPAGPDHGAAEMVDANLGGADVVDVGHNDATVEDDDATSADSTLLALGGEEVFGAHADSQGESESHFGDPLAPLCEGSEGQVCLQVLYADAYATDEGGSSQSRSQSGVLGACIGGTSADPTAECDGPVAAGVAESKGEAGRDQSSGRTTAGSESDAAAVCLDPDPITGACALGASALHSDGESNSGGSTGTASRDSYLLAVEAGGEEPGRIGDPTSFAVQPACAEPSLACIFLNQGETYVDDSVAGHAREALSAKLLPATPLEIEVELARTESLVHNDGPETTSGGGGGSGSGSGDLPGGGPRLPGTGGGGPTADLPDTGGIWSGLLAMSMFSIATGAFFIAYSRRRMAALV